MNSQEFYEKEMELTRILVKTIKEFTDQENLEMGIKISLRALVTVSAGTIFMLSSQNKYSDKTVLEYFVDSLMKSVDIFQAFADQSAAVINKAMGKQ